MQDRIEQLNAALEGRYRIEREVGSGGMATVYLAEDLKHARQVAVKVLHSHLVSALGGERFLREIQVSARLNHPHILTLIDLPSRLFSPPPKNSRSNSRCWTRYSRCSDPAASGIA